MLYLKNICVFTSSMQELHCREQELIQIFFISAHSSRCVTAMISTHYCTHGSFLTYYVHNNIQPHCSLSTHVFIECDNSVTCIKRGVINLRHACAVRVTVVGLCVCVSVCLSTTILALQATRRLMGDTNSFSATRA